MEKGNDLSEVLHSRSKLKTNIIEDKLRKPKEATLQKIKASHKKNVNVEAKDAIDHTKGSKLLSVPLRHEFLTKKQQIENATSDLLKRYESYKLRKDMLNDDYDRSTEEAQPLTLNKKESCVPYPELDYFINKVDNLESKSENTKTESSKTTIKKKIQNIYDILTYPEHVIYRIIYTKVDGHPNGFFADNIPDWYRRTFDKDLVPNWLEICRKSQQFLIENVQDKIVLYVRSEDDEEYVSDIDINACGDVKEKKAKASGSGSKDSSVGFLRYKHLEKSLQEYSNSAGRKNSSKIGDKFVKPTNKLIKPNQNVAKK